MAKTGAHWVVVGEAVSTTVDIVMPTMVVGKAVSTTVGAVMPTMVGDAASMSVSMADDVASMLVSMSMAGDAGRSIMVGEGAGESVDPNPVVPTIGAN
jgi:hypothetical protein